MALELNGTTGVSLVQDGVITDANLPAGSVLQVVENTYSTATSTTSGTYVETGLTASITPTSTDNKILVIGQVNGVLTTATATGVTVSLYRGSSSTILQVGQHYAGYDTSSTDNQVNVPFHYLDSPATTSATTYGFAFFRKNGSGNTSVQANSSESSIVLMEIAG